MSQQFCAILRFGFVIMFTNFKYLNLISINFETKSLFSHNVYFIVNYQTLDLYMI
jgi:hypothetical protein